MADITVWFRTLLVLVVTAGLPRKICCGSVSSQASHHSGPFDVVASSGSWLASQPLSTDEAGSGHIKAQFLGTQFRGTFRDLSLFVKRQDMSKLGALWVIEVKTEEDLANEEKLLSEGGLTVLMKVKLSLVVAYNDTHAVRPTTCLDEGENKTVISVANHEVSIRGMPEAHKIKYASLAANRDAQIVSLVGLVSASSLKTMLDHLQSYPNRNSYNTASGNLDKAAEWTAQKFKDYGFDVSRDSWSERGGIPSVVAELRGTESPEKVVVIGAHLDSINHAEDASDGSDSRAPGADDDGSGSVTMLEIARIISESGIRFKNTVILCHFTGEEQNLYGSEALAEKWSGQGKNILAMLNVDMIGYRGSGRSTLALYKRNVDQALNSIVKRIVGTYLPSLPVTFTGLCCSDQQSFYENGFSATTFFEMPSGANPKVHSRGDLTNVLDFEHMKSLASGVVASFAVFAEPSSAAPPSPPPSPTTRRRSSPRRRKGAPSPTPSSCPDMASCSYSKAACRKQAKKLGFELGSGEYEFAGVYSSTGCYSYSSGSFEGVAFYGYLPETEKEVQSESQLTAVSSPKQRLECTHGCKAGATRRRRGNRRRRRRRRRKAGATRRRSSR